MKTININGKDYTIEESSNILETAKKENPMDKIYSYHKTTEERFNMLYENVSEFAKNQEIEAMIVNYYNKGEKVDFNNHSQKRWYSWWYLGDNFRLSCVDDYCSVSRVPARLCFLREEDIEEATEVYFEQFKNSRNG